MAPAEWLCDLCTDVLVDPLTVPCCGESFCQQCLRQWTITKLDDGAAFPRCPAGPCGRKLNYRLPSISKVLSKILEPPQEDDVNEVILGGFTAWQEVAASRDIFVGEKIFIASGTSGIVLCNHESSHIKVQTRHVTACKLRAGEV